MKKLPGVPSFRGEYSFLSNFYPCRIIYDDIIYSSNEHFFQAMKTLDKNERIRIASFTKPAQTKRYARTLDLRPDWNNIRVHVMLAGLRKKFSDPILAEQLLNTKDIYLEEVNTWGDAFWGVCNGKGKNVLGQLLMCIRTEIDLNIKNI